MKKNLVAFTLGVSLLASAAAAETIPFHELRQDHPSIDAAIAALPNSDFNGSLNRVSAVLGRSQVEALAEGAWVAGQLPANVETNLTASLADVYLDIKDSIAPEGTLTVAQKLVLIQAIEVVAVSRSLELYDGWDDNPCVPHPEHPCPFDPRPATIVQLDLIAQASRPAIDAFITDFNATEDPDIAIVLPSTLRAWQLDGVLDGIRNGLTIKGVESIDD